MANEGGTPLEGWPEGWRAEDVEANAEPEPTWPAAGAEFLPARRPARSERVTIRLTPDAREALAAAAAEAGVPTAVLAARHVTDGLCGQFGAAGAAWAGFPPSRALAIVRALLRHDAGALATLLYGLTAPEMAGALAVAWGVADLMQKAAGAAARPGDPEWGAPERAARGLAWEMRRHPFLFGDFEVGGDAELGD